MVITPYLYWGIVTQIGLEGGREKECLLHHRGLARLALDLNELENSKNMGRVIIFLGGISAVMICGSPLIGLAFSGAVSMFLSVLIMVNWFFAKLGYALF